MTALALEPESSWTAILLLMANHLALVAPSIKGAQLWHRVTPLTPVAQKNNEGVGAMKQSLFKKGMSRSSPMLMLLSLLPTV
jgi:hypothetical protein